MNDIDQRAIEEVMEALSSMISRTENVKTSFKEGSAQHSLQRNRLQALRIALDLVKDPVESHYSQGELVASEAPIVSLISKSEKARQKLKPDSWQYAMLTHNLTALNTVLPILKKAILEGKTQ